MVTSLAITRKKIEASRISAFPTNPSSSNTHRFTLFRRCSWNTLEFLSFLNKRSCATFRTESVFLKDF
jgi:hypothetical protein